MVDIESIKTGLRGLKDDEIPEIKNVIKKSYLLMPPHIYRINTLLRFYSVYGCSYSTL